MSTATIRQHELERCTPATREAIRIAQREAMHMNAASVDPEHLLLGCVLQGDARVMDVLGGLGISIQAVRARVMEMSQDQPQQQLEVDDLPLSWDAQECLRWAISFISHMHLSSVFPEYVLLGVLRHQRTQSILSFLLPSGETLQARILEETGSNYTAYMDQFIQSRMRDQSVVSYGRGIHRRVLRRYERPCTTFMDVVGLHEAKRELRPVVDFLNAAPTFQLSGGKFPHGVLLIGSTNNDRRLLVQAVAGEAVVPLITVSMLALIEMLVDLNAGALSFKDLVLPIHEYELLKNCAIRERGSRYIQQLFQEAKALSPCILFLEDIDAVTRLSKNEGCDLLVRQILTELDALDKHYRMVAIASTYTPNELDPSLLRIGRFERQIIVDNHVENNGISKMQAIVSTTFCSSCRRGVQPSWQYCIYCGIEQANRCLQCGTPFPTIEGAHFCSGCGNSLLKVSTS